MTVLDALLQRYGRTFAEEAGIDVARDEPAPLFQLLVLSLLSSARIGHRIALRTTRELLAAGLRTPERMRDASWEERVAVLDRGGYVRYDERTATWLGEAAEHVLRCWHGDLRRLRADVAGDPALLAVRLEALRGIGPVGAHIFLREVQVAWPELFPFADARALDAAARLGLGATPGDLRAHARDPASYARLAAALVRCALEDGFDDVRRDAGAPPRRVSRADREEPAPRPAARAPRAPRPAGRGRRRP